MTGKKEKEQFYFVFALAVIVLVISIWAFVQGIHAPVQDIVQKDMSGKEVKQDQEKKTDATVVDTKVLADAVLSEISFETELVLLDDTVAESMITTADENTKIELYMGEGTCSDELLIVTASDEDSVKAEVESVQKHLTDMQQSFQDYLPKEAKKIDDAVILQTKNYIIACISSDKEKTKKVIEKQLK